jgi:tetratricopeptide (TPR) repeat protein
LDPLLLYLDGVNHTEHNAYLENQIGELVEGAGNLPDAESWYRRGIADRSDADWLHYNLGTLLAREGRMADAAEEFRIALDLLPDELRYQRSYAWARQRLTETPATTRAAP